MNVRPPSAMLLIFKEREASISFEESNIPTYDSKTHFQIVWSSTNIFKLK